MISLIIIIKFFLYRGGNVNGTFKIFPLRLFIFKFIIHMYITNTVTYGRLKLPLAYLDSGHDCPIKGSGATSGNVE